MTTPPWCREKVMVYYYYLIVAEIDCAVVTIYSIVFKEVMGGL